MTVCCALGWLGTGLVLAASPARSQRLFRHRAGFRVSWLLRGLGLGAWLGAAWALRAGLDAALVPIATLIALMAVASLASVLSPLWPRLYALTVPLSALVAALSSFLR